MELYPLRLLRSQPLRLGFTVGGVALCVVLMLFLLSVYRGVYFGSVQYIHENPTDLWVLQSTATNILRGTSFLTSREGNSIRKVTGVASSSAVLFLLSSVKMADDVGTVFLTGFDPEVGPGGPPAIVEGRSIRGEGEIVLDHAFAAKHRLHPGDRVQIQEEDLEVVGVSTGTNAFVMQYAFVSLQTARKLAGFPALATCYLVEVEESVGVTEVAEQIRSKISGVVVYDHDTFLANNIREMESGFIPLLYTVAALGAVVLTIILSLLLSINILERREDFAVMKALGSPGGFLPRLVIYQSLLISSMGIATALALFFPLVAAIEGFCPEVSTRSSMAQIAAVAVIVALISLVSAFISLQRLRKIYPLEAFS